MAHVRFDYSHVLDFLKEAELFAWQSKVDKVHHYLHMNKKEENHFTSWVHLPEEYDRTEFKQMKRVAKEIKLNSDVLLVIGVGGSYLGARAAIEMMYGSDHYLLPEEKQNYPQVIFVGQNMSARYIKGVLDLVSDKEFSINVISKSGTTTEPAIAFRIFRKLLIAKYGQKEARSRIFVTTDREKGALKQLAIEEGYETFVIPNDIGGRYSVLTAVGLLPIAVSGLDIDGMMNGANQARKDLSSVHLKENSAYQYAVIRNILYQKGKTLELLVNYEPSMHYFSQWWQQLFGESEGKNLQGIFPAYANFPTDLHSIGQYIQEGRRDLFETTIKVQGDQEGLIIEADKHDIDGLNYLAGSSIDKVNENIFEAALLAHTDGGVPNLIIEIPKMDAYTFGYLTYFFKKACAMSGLLAGVNPFDQPGVDMYKKNMYALLGKPGYEDEKEQIERRLGKLLRVSMLH